MKEKKKITLVVFDMAGTTVHDEGYVNKSLKNAFSRHGISVDSAAIDRVMGYPKPMAIHLLLKEKGNEAKDDQAFIEKVFAAFQLEMLGFYQNDPEVKAKEHVEVVFQELRANGIKIALDTGFDRKIADAIICRLGWENKIDASVTSDEVKNGRPHPDLIFEAMKRVGIENTENVAKVGDTVSDVQEGKAANCALVVAVTTGANDPAVLAAENPDACIQNLADLLNFIELN